jgi:UTP--glucose-1-phosphate uridylyltransferase
VEKPKQGTAPSNLHITGRYILQPEIFPILEQQERGAGGEIQLTDAMKEMCKEYPYFYKKIDEARFDCGNVVGYLDANIAFALNNDNIKHDVQKVLDKYCKNFKHNF